MTLRERKRARTRQALVDAATELFERQGYDETTIADITAKAEVGARTFFSYFASKEELLFPESDERVQATLAAIADRGADEGPAEVLLRALSGASERSDDMVSPLAALRLRLVQTVPAVRGKGLQLQLDAQREIARHLADAFPELDYVRASALTGAFIGAITAVLYALLEEGDPAVLKTAVQTAAEVALEPWRR
ncbi:TetR/AcrR family transcriptional regulator [Labedaea rhizosphaerae]|nr:TetR/AcrR family transcriptional regulator [Labedaea rhizosphaerae]